MSTNQSHVLIVQERNAGHTPQVQYTRGLDLSGTLEGAGGIGGLLMRSHGYSGGNWSTHNAYHSDANGNVTALMSSSGVLQASYKYNPYGGLISSSGTLAGANTMRFSSKPAILSATGAWGFYYYGYRFYDPGMQRWLNRDPLGVIDGNHLYTFIRNLPVSWVDPFGLKIEYGDDSDGEGAKQTIECWKKTLPKEANLLKLISEIESAKGTLEIKSMDGRNNANGDPISTPETVFNKVTKNSTMYIN